MNARDLKRQLRIERSNIYSSRAIENDLSARCMSECERYGFMQGCDVECPVFARGECENELMHKLRVEVDE